MFTNISWKYKIINIKVLDRAGPPSMEVILTQMNLRWLGHVGWITSVSLSSYSIQSNARVNATRADQGRDSKKLKEVGYRQELLAPGSEGQSRRGSRKNGHRFPKRAPKVQVSRRVRGHAHPRNFLDLTPLSPVS